MPTVTARRGGPEQGLQATFGAVLAQAPGGQGEVERARLGLRALLAAPGSLHSRPALLLGLGLALSALLGTLLLG